jgi:cyclase
MRPADQDLTLEPGQLITCVVQDAQSGDVLMVAWAREAAELGAGELLVTSIDSDGTHRGYDLELLRAVCDAVSLPVIASGGAGQPSDITAALETGASAALAASIFHDGTYPIHEVKREVAACGLPIRI